MKGSRIEHIIHEDDMTARRKLKKGNTIIHNANILALFETRQRGVELWKIASKHFSNRSVFSVTD